MTGDKARVTVTVHKMRFVMKAIAHILAIYLGYQNFPLEARRAIASSQRSSSSSIDFENHDSVRGRPKFCSSRNSSGLLEWQGKEKAIEIRQLQNRKRSTSRAILKQIGGLDLAVDIDTP